MRGSRVPNPITCLALALFGGMGAMALAAAPATAADPAPAVASVGPPTSLLPSGPMTSAPPSGTPFATTSFAPTPARSAAVVASPGRHLATPVQRAPLEAKPLIPPAPLPAKLGPPPPPRSALSLETDLQPLSPVSSATPQPAAAGDAAPSPPSTKPPSS